MKLSIWIGIYLIVIIVLLTISLSCTENTRVRTWGGEETIHLPKGEKLLEVTWKDNSNLWYLVEDMDSNYTPKTKTFQEDSRFGILEGKVIFIENK